MKKVISTALFLAVVLAITGGIILANGGQIDPSWGDDGVTIVENIGVDDLGNTADLMPNGKLLVAGWTNAYPGDFGVLRFLPDGSLDPNFGDGGKVAIPFSSDVDLVDAAWSVSMRPDGGVYVAGETCDADYIICDFALAGLNPDGSLDENFGTDGLVITSTGEETDYGWPRRNVVQADGKVVVGGVSYNDGEDFDMALRRHKTDGELDDTFGSGGIVVQDLDGANNYPQDISAFPGNKVLAVGGFGIFDENPFLYDYDKSFMALFDSSGKLDSGFGGGDGYVAWDYKGTPSIAMGGVLLNDQIYILGLFETSCTLQRFAMDGTADTTFGDDGWVIIDFPYGGRCWDIRTTPDGKIAFDAGQFAAEEPMSVDGGGRSGVVGRSPVSPMALSVVDLPALTIGRYLADGTPDETFGENGIVSYFQSEFSGAALNLAVQPDGKLIVTSDLYDPENDQVDISVLRFLGEEPEYTVFAPVVASSKS